MGSAINQAPGSCQCTNTCSTTIAGTLKGCNALGLDGATVAAHDATAGGTLLGTTTTAGGGAFSLTVSGVIGNAIVLVFSATGFTTQTYTLAYSASTADMSHWKCGGTSTITTTTLAVAAGYHCLGGYASPATLCAQSIPDTLHFTHSLFGSGTMTWSGVNNWTGTISYAYPGCGLPGCICAAKTITVSIGLIVQVTSLVVQTSFNVDIGGCPATVGTLVNDNTNAVTLTCSPLNISGTQTSSGGHCLFCGGLPVSITITP